MTESQRWKTTFLLCVVALSAFLVLRTYFPSPDLAIQPNAMPGRPQRAAGATGHGAIGAASTEGWRGVFPDEVDDDR
jgi:hypothetical protein